MNYSAIDSHLFMAGNSSEKTASVPNKKMQNDKSKLKPIVRLKGFTLLELLIALSKRLEFMSLIKSSWKLSEKTNRQN